jgi:hypothetical protein
LPTSGVRWSGLGTVASAIWKLGSSVPFLSTAVTTPLLSILTLSSADGAVPSTVALKSKLDAT